MEGNVKIISGIVDNKRTNHGITDFGNAIDQSSEERCCGPDCCEGVYRWKDVVTGAKYVSYVKNGTLTTATLAVYEADKANNFA